MSSNYLWKLYLENDAEGFRRLLLEGKLSSTQPRDSGSKAGEGGVELDKKASHEEIDGEAILGTPSKPNVASGQSLKRLKDIRLSFNRQALRDYDSMGRSLIHLAATDSNGIPFLRVLLKHPQLDLTHADLESGWTALHRALYNGNITAARLLLDAEAEKIATGGIPSGGILVKTKDYSGESPFELFYATIEGREDLLQNRRYQEENCILRMRENLNSDASQVEEGTDSDRYDDYVRAQGKLDSCDWQARHLARLSENLFKKGAGDEVFAFGSNKNHTLGFGDENDRQFPQRVPLQRPRQLLAKMGKRDSYHDLKAVKAFKPLHIRDIQLSKLHSAILTSDLHHNLYICGFGHGGRLGLGDEQLTQFTYKNVPIGDKTHVCKVALGLDHTVVVLLGGEVWTWGLNKNGQLGYATGKAVAAHGNGVHGQSKQKKGGQGSSSLEEAEFIQSTPRRIVDIVKKKVIRGCAASRMHTVLHTAKSLYVFGKNVGQLGILEASELSTPAWIPKKVVAGFLTDHTIEMVAATDNSTVVILENRDVWVFANYAYTRVIFPVPRLMSAPRLNYRAHDNRRGVENYITKISTGGDIICGLTRIGDVYTVKLGDSSKSTVIAAGKLVLPAAQRVWNRKKSSMAATDVDVDHDGSIILCTEAGSVWRRVKRTKVIDQQGASGNIGAGGGSNISTPFGVEGKSRDYKFSRVPGLTRIISVRSNKFGAYAAIRKDCNIMTTQLQVSKRDHYHSWVTLPPHFYGLHPMFDTRNWLKHGIEFPDMTNLRRWRKLLESVDTDGCDMVVRAVSSDLKIPVHKAIFLARCNIMPRKLIEAGNKGNVEWGKGSLKLIIDEHGLRLDINEDFGVIMLLVIDIYALKVLSHTFSLGLRSRVSALGNALQVVGHDSPLETTYRRDTEVNLSKALRDPLYGAHGDIILQLADGDKLRVYSTLLRHKSPFFETLFKGSANGKWIETRLKQMKAAGETAIGIDMTHIRREIFQIVLDYIYTGRDDLLKNLKGFEDLDSYLDFVLEILAVSDELMIDDLSRICQNVIGPYGM